MNAARNGKSDESQPMKGNGQTCKCSVLSCLATSVAPVLCPSPFCLGCCTNDLVVFPFYPVVFGSVVLREYAGSLVGLFLVWLNKWGEVWAAEKTD